MVVHVRTLLNNIPVLLVQQNEDFCHSHASHSAGNTQWSDNPSFQFTPVLHSYLTQVRGCWRSKDLSQFWNLLAVTLVMNLSDIYLWGTARRGSRFFIARNWRQYSVCMLSYSVVMGLKKNIKISTSVQVLEKQPQE